jgi:hypothetical protein
MNLEKYRRKNQAEELKEGEENVVPMHARSARVLGAYVKIGKPASRKFRSQAPPPPPAESPIELMREPGAVPKASAVKRSQASSWDHLHKQEHQLQLRAPAAVRRSRRAPAKPK